MTAWQLGMKRALTETRHRGPLWGDGNVLYPDCRELQRRASFSELFECAFKVSTVYNSLTWYMFYVI